jgi:hypothetical protein
VRTIPDWLPLTLLVTLSAGLRLLAALTIPGPWIAADEMVYAELGRSLWSSGDLTILGQQAPFYSLVHPLLIGFPLALFDGETGYILAKALQSVAMSLAAVPVYFWCRAMMPVAWSFLAATLTLAIPGLAYSGLLMTEATFYPLMVLAAWAMARALERPTRTNQALLVGAVALACATRLAAAVLVPALVTAILLKALLDRSRATIHSFVPTLAGLLGVGVLWAGWRLRDGGPWTKLLGAYGAAGESSYGVGDAARFVLYHAGDALLVVAIVPACAVALLAYEGFRRGEPSEAVRAYLAVAVAVPVWLVLEVGVFASRYVGRLAERHLLAIAPLLFVGFALWLSRGAPRTRLSGAVAGLVAAAFVLLLPFGKLVYQAALPDAFMLVPLEHARDAGFLDLAAYGAVGLLVLLFALLPARGQPVLALGLVAGFALLSVLASVHVTDQARAQSNALLGPEPRWLDRAAESTIAYHYDGEAHWNAVWLHQFWNKKLRRVYDYPESSVPGPLPQTAVRPLKDGRLVDGSGAPVDADYIVGSTAFTYFGNPVAQIQQVGPVHRGLTLWQVEPPLRLRTVTTGVQGSGDIYDAAQLVAYDCRGGELAVTLVAKDLPETVEFFSGRLSQGRVDLEPREVWSGTIPAVPVDGVCQFNVDVGSLVGSTRFEYTR